MNTVTTVAALTAAINQAKQDKKSIGLVPTMGALHEGHLSLVRRARAENDVVVVSVFVNPIQFNNKEDLAKYPRTVEQDCKLLAEAGADIAFVPSVEEMYPEPVNTVYHFGPLEEVMEGPRRPGAPPLRPGSAYTRLFRREGLSANCHHPQSAGTDTVPHRAGALPHCPRRRRPGFEQPQYAPQQRGPRSGPQHLCHPGAGRGDVGV